MIMFNPCTQVPFHFQDKLKKEIQNTILVFVFNTNNGNGNSINCQFCDILSIFYSEFQIFSFVLHLLSQQKLYHRILIISK